MNRFLDLSIQTQADIADCIDDMVAEKLDVIDIEAALQEENPEIRPCRMPVAYIQVREGHTVNEDNIQLSLGLPPEGSPPILIDGPHLLDGAHRLEVVRRRGHSFILSVDIGFLLRRSWLVSP